jgi:serine/threonine protein kinase/tetratricopeptide (TPR) repeat protein
MNDQPDTAMPTRLADFQVIRRLGAGGMAEVFLAKKQGAEGTYKLLVVKRVLPAYGSSRRFRAMFAEEAQLATRLNHPNIVQVYDFQDYGEEGQLLSMEYVEGPDLRKLLRSAQSKGMRLPPYVSAYVISEVAKGLHYAHERKDEGGGPLEIVHRDVSPQNILLSFEGAAKIADFGIATANLFREEPGVLKGKTGYMSPEQARGERVDRRTDVYSLGVVFHEMLTARPLHGAAEGAELMEAVRAGAVEPPSTFAREIPPELEAIVMRSLSKTAADRFQSAREMAAAITRVLFQKLQLVDSHVLETTIAQLVSREHTSPGRELGSVASTQFAYEVLGDREGALAVARVDRERTAEEQTGPGRPYVGQRGRDQHGREVRHVAIVALRLHGLQALEEAVGAPAALHFLEQLRTTLGEIAFKRGARWSWEERHVPAAAGSSSISGVARAVLGLTTNPSRAAADAAWLAIDVHEAIHGACDDMPVELLASVGIVRGVAAGQRDKLGHLIDHSLEEPAHYLAEMLGDQAPPGASWVAGGLYRMVRRDFIWGDVPTVEIEDAASRDLPRNMRIYALLRPLTREEKQQQLAFAPNDLIGRDAELADLHAAFHQALTPGPNGGLGLNTARVVFGEMGIGKSALVLTFLSELPPDARVLRVECSPARSELPFAAIADWVRELVGLPGDHPIDQVKQVIRETLGDFAEGKSGDEVVQRLAELATGKLAAAADEAEFAHKRRLTASGMRRFFARTAIDTPLVVVVEGIQWSDRPSMEIVSELLRRPDPLPILTILVARPDDRIEPYIQGMVRIELRGLGLDSQLRLLQARLGVTEGVRQVCADILPRAGGNPFFLLELVDALLERGNLEIRELPDGKQQLVRVERPGEPQLALPSTLEQLIADRLNELPREEQCIVEWLSVNGGPLSEADLLALEPGASDALVRLCARGLCDINKGAVDVRHPLTRDVAYMALERTARVRMHRRIGEYLADTSLAKGLTAALVARHLARGNDKQRAADLYLEAAHSARDSYQMQLATRYFRRSLSLLPENDLRRLDAHEALEALCRIQGRWRERRKHLSALRQLAKRSKSAHWAATALLRTARFELDGGRLSRGLSSVQRAEKVARVAGSSMLEVQAQALMAEMLRDLGDMQGALSACDRALKTASEPDVPSRLLAEVLTARGTLLRRVGRVHEAVEAQAEAIAIFRGVGARRFEARAKNSLAFGMFVLGRFEDAIALALDAIRIDLAIGGRFQIAKTLSTIGRCYARLGDVPRGLAYLKRARDAHERYGDQDARAETLLSTAEVLIEAGDYAAADTYVGDAGALTAVTGSAYDLVHEKILRALLARAGHDAGSAVMYAFEARQAAEAQAYVAYHFYAMAVEASARVDIGELHTGILLATTAMGAIETVQGSEYGLATRVLCCEALERAGSPQARDMQGRAARYANHLIEMIRDPELREMFTRRRYVAALLAQHERGGSAAEPAGERLDARDESVRPGSDRGTL